jgi:aryl-alcohol dehydrogenase-like predicted oxidoreductase
MVQGADDAAGGPGPRVPITRLAANLRASRLGLGCMVMTRSYAAPDETEARRTFAMALDLGVTLLDTADSYAAGENERFVAAALRGRRDEAVLCSKFGLVPQSSGGMGIDGRPERVRACCEATLARLGVDHLDVYYLHRVDPVVPLPETVGAMAELVTAGKIRHLGLCEVTAEQLRVAHAVHPIAVVQSEWSLWARQIEDDVLPVARGLGVGIVPCAPLGRGFLAGAIDRQDQFPGGDLRAGDPRLQGDNLDQNLRALDELRKLAENREATPAQVALAWLFAQGTDIVPIPGVERRGLLRENLAALAIDLDPTELRRLGEAFRPGSTAGNPDEVLLRGPALDHSGD